MMNALLLGSWYRMGSNGDTSIVSKNRMGTLGSSGHSSECSHGSILSQRKFLMGLLPSTTLFFFWKKTTTLIITQQAWDINCSPRPITSFRKEEETYSLCPPNSVANVHVHSYILPNNQSYTSTCNFYVSYCPYSGGKKKLLSSSSRHPIPK